MSKILNSIFLNIKQSYSILTMLVFIASGIYLIIIDGADLNTKDLKDQLKLARILGLMYIFGSIAFFIFIQFV